MDFVVDALSPVMPLFWRRASTFCKALLKKSSSSALSTSTRFSWLTSLWSVDSREFPGGGSSPWPKGSTVEKLPDARQVPVTIPQCCRRSSTARRPSGGILSDIAPLVSSWPLSVPFPAKCARSECLKLRVQSRRVCPQNVGNSLQYVSVQRNGVVKSCRSLTFACSRMFRHHRVGAFRRVGFYERRRSGAE